MGRPWYEKVFMKDKWDLLSNSQESDGSIKEADMPNITNTSFVKRNRSKKGNFLPKLRFDMLTLIFVLNGSVRDILNLC